MAQVSAEQDHKDLIQFLAQLHQMVVVEVEIIPKPQVQEIQLADQVALVAVENYGLTQIMQYLQAKLAAQEIRLRLHQFKVIKVVLVFLHLAQVDIRREAEADHLRLVAMELIIKAEQAAQELQILIQVPLLLMREAEAENLPAQRELVALAAEVLDQIALTAQVELQIQAEAAEVVAEVLEKLVDQADLVL